AFQAVSLEIWFVLLSFKVVPPTASTFGDEAGHSGPKIALLSPAEATYVTPGAVKFASKPVSPANSLAPQLIDTTLAPILGVAVFTAVIKLLRLAELASTSTIFAPGATACAHSTSRLISTAQLALAWGRLVPPFWFTTVRLAVGRPYFASNVA